MSGEKPQEFIQLIIFPTRWTNQEALLSEGRLFFTNEQTYFECTMSCRQETLKVPPRRPSIHQMDDAPLYVGLHKSSLILEAIDEYSRRHLSYDSDILNGILGTFQAITQLSLGPIHPRGLPCASMSWSENTSSRVNFLARSCWQPKHRSHRRPGFPSWCWTGWHSLVHFDRFVDAIDDISVAVETSDGIVMDWLGARDAMTEWKHDLLSTYIHLNVTTIQTRFMFLHDGITINNASARAVTTVLSSSTEF
jgi:hypothetical protein